MSDKNDFSDLTDHELVQAYCQTGDPWVFEMLKAEERRRTAEKAIKQATTSNKIAIASLIVATGSLGVAVLTMLSVFE
ncbi:hypothetical protein RYZ26_17005 [Terasakiella sp. A23]|uniref:hypothetical protein n=1 Tax=Terasakiella sp. FCG-A23 TaxID=3080561 RepID=UPI0029532C23|nr:hypothetical protein [Terasakiella sp. A23]MDV7341311.1 hypothetical protein [Terasakiella sp. A23]